LSNIPINTQNSNGYSRIKISKLHKYMKTFFIFAYNHYYFVKK